MVEVHEFFSNRKVLINTACIQSVLCNGENGSLIFLIGSTEKSYTVKEGFDTISDFIYNVNNA